MGTYFTYSAKGSSSANWPSVSASAHGADPTGNRDLYPALMEAIAAAQYDGSQIGGRKSVFLEPGEYRLKSTIMLQEGVRIWAENPLTTVIFADDVYHPCHGFVAYPKVDSSLMPLVAGPYGLGKALDMTGARWADASTPWRLNLMEWTPYASLNGFTQLNLRFWFKAGSLSGINQPIYTVWDYFETDICFQVYANSDRTLGIIAKSAGGSHSSLSGSVICQLPNDGAWHHIELDWDGTTVRTYMDWVFQHSYAFDGHLVHTNKQGAYVGSTILGTIAAGYCVAAAKGYLYGLHIRNASFAAQATTPLTGPHTADANTWILMNLDQVVGNQLYVEAAGVNPATPGFGYRQMVLLDCAQTLAANNGGTKSHTYAIEGIGLSGFNNAIWTAFAAVSRYENLNIVARHPLHVTNQGFTNRFEKLTLNSSGTAAFALAQAAGDHGVHDVFCNGTPYFQELVEMTDNVRFTGEHYLQIPTGYCVGLYGAWSVDFNAAYKSLEGTGAPLGLVDAWQTNATFHGGFFNNNNFNVPGIRFANKCTLTAVGPRFTANVAGPFFQYGTSQQVGAGFRNKLTVLGYDNFYNTGGDVTQPTTPLFPAPQNGDSFIWLDSPNRCGTAAASGATATVSVTLPLAEPDTTYRVTLTPTTTTGSPAVGSNRVLSLSKTTSGFTATLEAAPGVGNTVSFDWALTR